MRKVIVRQCLLDKQVILSDRLDINGYAAPDLRYILALYKIEVDL